MSEKDMFLAAWAREHATTVKVLKQLPADKANFKPAADKTKSAKDLASVFIEEMNLIDFAVKGEVDFSKMGGSKAPDTISGVIETYQKTHAAATEQVAKMTDAEWNGTMTMPVGPQKMGQVRRGDVCWMTLMDSVHHRGQFSVYLRLVGAKVPSIYGPSADEPWGEKVEH